MVWQHVCILLLRLLTANSLFRGLKHFYFTPQDKCYQYWPTEGSVTHGEITIEIKSDTLSEAISIRDFLVTFNQVLLPETFSFLWTEHPAAVVWDLCARTSCPSHCSRSPRLCPWSVWAAGSCVTQWLISRKISPPWSFPKLLAGAWRWWGQVADPKRHPTAAHSLGETAVGQRAGGMTGWSHRASPPPPARSWELSLCVNHG